MGTAPRIALIGFYDGSTLRPSAIEGLPLVDAYGIAPVKAFFIFPVNLRNLHLGVLLYKPTSGETNTILFKGGTTKREFTLQLMGAEIQKSDPSVSDESIGWIFTDVTIGADIVVEEPDDYEASVDGQLIGHFGFVDAASPPLTGDEIKLIKSSLESFKTIKFRISCNFCNSKRVIYAGVERVPTLEADGAIWNHDLEDAARFRCSCGKTDVSLNSVKHGLHALLRGRLTGRLAMNFDGTPLHTRESLRQLAGDLQDLLDGDNGEQVLQSFIENNPICLSAFGSITRIISKPSYLGQKFGDLALVTRRQELIAIELEQSTHPIFKKDGDLSRELNHALRQTADWDRLVRDHFMAVLDTLKLTSSEVSAVKYVVIQGRSLADKDANHRFRKWPWPHNTSVWTYDDVVNYLLMLSEKLP